MRELEAQLFICADLIDNKQKFLIKEEVYFQDFLYFQNIHLNNYLYVHAKTYPWKFQLKHKHLY